MQYINAKDALISILKKQEELKKLNLNVTSRALKNEEAIGNPTRTDFPLLQGKEVLLQVDIDGGLGQAFTSAPVAYQGNIEGILDFPSDEIGNNALFVATLNAIAHKLGLVEKTKHCINDQPEQCGQKISANIKEKYGLCNIGIIGYQPAIIENCVKVFGAERVKVTDLDVDTVGTTSYGVKILDGMTDTKQLIDFADLLLITGTVLANNTFGGIKDMIGQKPYYFFGTTCAALAHFYNVYRLCPMSS